MPRADTSPQLRHKVNLYSESQATPNAMGEVLSGETLVDAVWADVEPLSATEAYRAQRLGQKQTHKFIIRWRAGVGTGDTIKWRGAAYRVETVHDPDQRREWLHIMASDERRTAS